MYYLVKATQRQTSAFFGKKFDFSAKIPFTKNSTKPQKIKI